MQRLSRALVLMTCCAPWIAGQDADVRSYPKFEYFAGYSAIETNDHNFHFASLYPGGFNATNTDFDEGGWGIEGAIMRNLNRYFGIMGAFSAHFSDDRGFIAVTNNGQGPVLIGPCNQPPCSAVAQGAEINPKLFDFVAGPEIKWRNRSRFTPFAHALFGLAHATATFKTAGQALTLSATDSDNGFEMRFGGGFDLRITRRMSFRGMLTYGQAFAGSNALPRQRVNQEGWSSGILFH
jgi:hypothetical protein